MQKRKLGTSSLEVTALGFGCMGMSIGYGPPADRKESTNDLELMRALAVAGVGLLYMFEPEIADALRRGSLRLVLEPYAAAVPGFFLYFPSRAQVSPALRAFVNVARDLSEESKQRTR